MQFEISSLRIISPSPTTFILDVEQTTDETSATKHITYIGSGEHCFEYETLLNSKLAHSTIYSMNPGKVVGSISAYAIFDLNDVLVGTDVDFNNTDASYNYMLAPTMIPVEDKLNNPVKGIVNNKNAFIGYIPGTIASSNVQMTPTRKYDSPTDLYYKYTADKDAISLYSKRRPAINSRQVLRLNNEYDVSSDDTTVLSDDTIIQNTSKFDQLYVIQTFNAFSSDGNGLDATQDIKKGWSKLVNDFDNGTLTVASFITPKQTLNAEYSTAKSTKSAITAASTLPYKYMRDYTANDDFNMYASGNLLIFNYIETKALISTGTVDDYTQISTLYSKNIGLTSDKFGSAQPHTMSYVSSNLNISGIYQNYLPEIVNVNDDGFGGGKGTPGAPGAKRAIHKANIFDIQLTEKYAPVIANVPAAIAEAYSNATSATSAVYTVTDLLKSKLQKHISNRLQALVAEIIPAHTHLYRVVTADEATGSEPTLPVYPFYVFDGMLKVKFNPPTLPYRIIFKDQGTYSKVEMIIDTVAPDNELTLTIKPYTGPSDSVDSVAVIGTGKFPGLYSLYVYNGNAEYSLIVNSIIKHPFTIIDGELFITYNTAKPQADLLFVDVANNDRVLMHFELVDGEIITTINIPYAGAEEDADNICITTLNIVDSGTTADEYILYVNNRDIQLSHIN